MTTGSTSKLRSTHDGFACLYRLESLHSGAREWTAPTAGPFNAISFWSEFPSSNFQINGGAGVTLGGVFFTPEAKPFSLAGGGNLGAATRTVHQLPTARQRRQQRQSRPRSLGGRHPSETRGAHPLNSALCPRRGCLVGFCVATVAPRRF